MTAPLANSVGINSGFHLGNWDLEEGDFFTASDIVSGARVCVVGKTVVDQLFAGEDPVGKNIRIKNMSFRVTGVLSAKDSASLREMTPSCFSPMTTRTSRARILPLTRRNESDEEWREGKGRLKTPPLVVA